MSAKKAKKKSHSANARRVTRTRAGARKRRSADDLTNRIVQAAADEFKRSGFAGTTTAVIARKADVTEAQLFRYFGSKANLFRETIFKPLDEQLSAFHRKHLSDGVTTEKMRDIAPLYTTELLEFIRENSAMLISLIVAQAYDSGTAHGVGEIKSLRTFFDHSATLMRSRMKTTPKVAPELMVRLTFATVLASVVFRDWIFPRGLASEAEIAAAVASFVMDGISASYEK